MAGTISLNAYQQGMPLWWVHQLYQRLISRQVEINLYDDYYRGEFPLPWLAPDAQEPFRRILKMSRANYMGLVIDAQCEREAVEGFRVPDDSEGSRRRRAPNLARQVSADAPAIHDGGMDGALADDNMQRIWEANSMDTQMDQGLLEAAICGMSYLLVAPNPEQPELPFMWVEHASQTIIAFRAGTNRREAVAALKVYADEWTGQKFATLYLPEWIWKFSSNGLEQQLPATPALGSVASQIMPIWDLRTPNGDATGERNPLNLVPLFEIPNNPRLLSGGQSELYDLIDSQDRIVKTIADRLMHQDFGAFPQKWASGWPLEDASGTPTPPIKVGRDRMVTTEVVETKFGQFAQGDGSIYLEAKEQDVTDIASRSRTPAQYLLGKMSNVNGDAMSLSTMIPTPQGMIPIGDIVAGQQVYDEMGAIQTVEHAHPVLLGRDCSRITFDTGDSFIVDDDHRWAVISIPETCRASKGRKQRTERSVLTTRKIRESLTDATGQYVHAIDLAGALDNPETDLPIDPYVLGAFLGDGGAHHGTISAGEQDVDEMVTLLEAAGATVSRRLESGGRKVSILTIKGQRGALNRLGLLAQPKHIPEAYFGASIKQRLALLQGLMDTDGTTSRRHRNTVALDLHDERLARDAYRLICSLGHKVSFRSSPFTNKIPNGNTVTGVRYRMRWCPPEIVFRMARKVEIQEGNYLTGRGVGVGRPKVLRRTIVSVEPVESQPVRCLTVTGPSHLYLAGEAGIATHNTLKASESGLVAKVRQRFRGYEPGLEDGAMLAYKIGGYGDIKASGRRLETIWRNPEFRTEGELVDALLKMRDVGVPEEALWERWGATPQEIRRWKRMLEEKMARAAAGDATVILAETFRAAAAAPIEAERAAKNAESVAKAKANGGGVNDKGTQPGKPRGTRGPGNQSGGQSSASARTRRSNAPKPSTT